MALPKLAVLFDALSVTATLLERELAHYASLQEQKNELAKDELEQALKEQRAQHRDAMSKRYAKYLDKYTLTKEQEAAHKAMYAALKAARES